jgi:hypothetical protein
VTEVVCCDISQYQPPVDNRYPHEWLIFRACFGGDYLDPNAARNLAWCLDARESGTIRGFTVYVVFLPGETMGILRILDQLNVPDDCVLMVDAENWNGQAYQISGDHSDELNTFATKLRVRQQGRADLVWAYGNRGPDLAIWPRKPKWLRWVVASYGGTKPDVPNMAGWQYTNGQYSVPGYPNSTPPFGRCDHNILYDPPEHDMAISDADAEKIINHLMRRQMTKDPADTFANMYRQIRASVIDQAQLADLIVSKLEAAGIGKDLTQADVTAAVRAVFADAGQA